MQTQIKTQTIITPKYFNMIYIPFDFAHHVLTSNPPATKVIGISEMRDNINTRWYSKEEVDDIVNRMFKSVEKLEILWNSHKETDTK